MAAGRSCGPAIAAAEASQRAFDSIEHVGLLGGASAAGVGRCSQGLTPVDDVDFMAHDRRALTEAGFQVLQDNDGGLRAVDAGVSFEVKMCRDGGWVWAGRSTWQGALEGVLRWMASPIDLVRERISV